MTEPALVERAGAVILPLERSVDRSAPAVRREALEALENGGVVVRTKHGRVRARAVVVATGYATPEFRPLAGRFRMMRTYVVATDRIGARTARAARGIDAVPLRRSRQ